VIEGAPVTIAERFERCRGASFAASPQRDREASRRRR
jgi:hypothetical protein